MISNLKINLLYKNLVEKLFFCQYHHFLRHYYCNTFNNITVTLQLMPRRLKSPASRLFAQPFVQAHTKENIKAQGHWPLWGEPTGDRWIPLTHKGSVTRKIFPFDDVIMNQMIETKTCDLVLTCYGYGYDHMETSACQGPVSLRLMTSQFKDILNHKKNKSPQDAHFAVYGFKILCTISKVSFAFSHPIFNPYTTKYLFYEVLKAWRIMIFRIMTS